MPLYPKYKYLIVSLLVLTYSPHGTESGKIPFLSTKFFMFILYSFIIVIFAGAMSGLTVGYTSIDPLQLEIILLNGTEI